MAMDSAGNMHLPAAGVKLHGKDRFGRSAARLNAEYVPGLEHLPQARLCNVEEPALIEFPKDLL